MSGDLPPSGPNDKLYCVKWVGYHELVQSALSNHFNLLEKTKENHFADVSIACRDKVVISAHRLVLASSSSYFFDILIHDDSDIAYLIMENVDSSDMRIILEYMYKGKALVNSVDYIRIVEIAKNLKIRGFHDNPSSLTKHETNFDSPPQELTKKNFERVNSTSTPMNPKLNPDSFKRECTDSISYSNVGNSPRNDHKWEETANLFPHMNTTHPGYFDSVNNRAKRLCRQDNNCPEQFEGSSRPSSFQAAHPWIHLPNEKDRIRIATDKLLNSDRKPFDDSSLKRKFENDGVSLLNMEKSLMPQNNPYLMSLPSFAMNAFEKKNTYDGNLNDSIQKIAAQFKPIKEYTAENLIRNTAFQSLFYRNYDFSEMLNRQAKPLNSRVKNEAEEIPAAPLTSPLISISPKFSPNPSTFPTVSSATFPTGSTPVFPRNNTPAYPVGNTPSFPNGNQSVFPTPFSSNSPPVASNSENSNGGGNVNAMQYDDNSFVNYKPGSKPEWKRYKQYSKEDLANAIKDVKSGISANKASRKHKVPSRTLYDKIKKLGIITPSSRRMPTAGRPRNGTTSSHLQMEFGPERTDSFVGDGYQNEPERAREGEHYNGHYNDVYESRPHSAESSATYDSSHPLDLQVPKSQSTDELMMEKQFKLKQLCSSLNSYQNLPSTIDRFNHAPQDNLVSNLRMNMPYNAAAQLDSFRSNLFSYPVDSRPFDLKEDSVPEPNLKAVKVEEECEVVVDSDSDKEPTVNNGAEYDTSAYVSQTTVNNHNLSSSPILVKSRDSGNDSNELCDSEGKKAMESKAAKSTDGSPEHLTKTPESTNSDLSTGLPDKSPNNTELNYTNINEQMKKRNERLSDLGLCSQIRPLDLRENISIPQESV